LIAIRPRRKVVGATCGDERQQQRDSMTPGTAGTLHGAPSYPASARGVAKNVHSLLRNAQRHARAAIIRRHVPAQIAGRACLARAPRARRVRGRRDDGAVGGRHVVDRIWKRSGQLALIPLEADHAPQRRQAAGRLDLHERMAGMTTRGMNYWESAGGRDQRLIFAMDGLLQEIDARTGKSVMSFGTNGVVDLRVGLDGRSPEAVGNIQSSIPGEVFGTLVIVGSATGEGYMSPPGDIRAYDVVTGALAWTFHTVPRPGESGARDQVARRLRRRPGAGRARRHWHRSARSGQRDHRHCIRSAVRRRPRQSDSRVGHRHGASALVVALRRRLRRLTSDVRDGGPSVSARACGEHTAERRRDRCECTARLGRVRAAAEVIT